LIEVEQLMNKLDESFFDVAPEIKNEAVTESYLTRISETFEALPAAVRQENWIKPWLEKLRCFPQTFYWKSSTEPSKNLSNFIDISFHNLSSFNRWPQPWSPLQLTKIHVTKSKFSLQEPSS
jgi:hypothetical protein